ncbi:hypothetical protein HOI18_03895 [Candidatus Uhrbacteria bacterium]|nr:hypothetical protein [Candidatus Uhrbacteria bacterium]
MLYKYLLIHAVVANRNHDHHGTFMLKVVTDDMHKVAEIVRALGWTERFAQEAFERDGDNALLQYAMQLRVEATKNSSHIPHPSVTFRTMQIMDA